MNHSSRVLITGASSGIGRELARVFAREGKDLIITARREERLQDLKGELESRFSVEAAVIPADLTRERDMLYDRVKEQGLNVEVLVNNAGFGGHGLFVEREWEKDRAMITLNVLALTELTRRFLPEMIERGSGGILNIASTAAFLPGPLQAVYYATKAFVVSFSQAIAEEVRDSGVKVAVYCPAATATEFASVGTLENTPLFQGRLATPLEVAERAYATLKKGRLVGLGGAGLHKFAFRFLFPYMRRRTVLRFSRSFME